MVEAMQVEHLKIDPARTHAYWPILSTISSGDPPRPSRRNSCRSRPTTEARRCASVSSRPVHTAKALLRVRVDGSRPAAPATTRTFSNSLADSFTDTNGRLKSDA